VVELLAFVKAEMHGHCLDGTLSCKQNQQALPERLKQGCEGFYLTYRA
jgi:hypothetical protein